MIVKNLCESFKIPLTGWYPSEVPGTQDPVLAIDCAGKTSEEIVRKAVNHTYNIVEDDVRLRFDPSRFEKERENYPVRREFSYYSINLKDGNEEAEKLLRDLGFKVIS
jgi:erythronate-4-phosphate dehydrogenase